MSVCFFNSVIDILNNLPIETVNDSSTAVFKKKKKLDDIDFKFNPHMLHKYRLVILFNVVWNSL